MTEERKIVPLGTDEQAGEPQQRDENLHYPQAHAVAPDEPGAVERANPRAFALLTATAMILIAVWTALLVAAVLPEVGNGATVAQWAGWLRDWTMPVLLIVTVWALLLFGFGAGTTRLAGNAARLREDARILEDQLTRVNGELSIAREFLTYQARDLESLGRVTVDRIDESATRMEALIAHNAARVQTLQDVSSAALHNMEQMRGQVPVLTNTARDLANAVGQVGTHAQEQVRQLVTRLETLDQQGEASTVRLAEMQRLLESAAAQAQALATQVDDISHDSMTQLETRLVATAEQAHAAFNNMDAQTAAMLGTAEKRIAAAAADISNLHEDLSRQGEAMDAQIAQRRTESGELNEALIERLAARLAEIDAELEERRRQHDKATQALARSAQEIAHNLDAYARTMQLAAQQGARSEETVLTGLDTVEDRLAASREALVDIDRTIARASQQGAHLLEMVEQSSLRTRDALPVAFADAQQMLEGLNTGVETVRNLLIEANDDGRSLGEMLARTGETTSLAMAQMHNLHDTIQVRGSEHAEQLGELQDMLAAVRSDSAALADSAEQALAGQLTQLREAGPLALQGLETDMIATVQQISRQLADEASAALANALEDTTDSTARELNTVVAGAINAASDASADLARRLAQVEEVTRSLDQRIAKARDATRTDVDVQFARRVSLIVTMLNATSLDLQRIFAADVSDSAWHEYLRGDAGIFTRRAVRLLGQDEARMVHSLYATDAAFREHVTLYISKFEDLLRDLLATGEGEALAVTLVSSDMGKLYVALAQGIDRLRH
ncbi:hypothetical protein RM533_04790 [Croceicoccus sp. F390]|uniref:ATPase n=1 Tax=Croceicoccus esteveae TaxID=3075597 RepID=A0ABU2ZGQ0_9SPHN|nr:hypothetical protein [Croceicoccus sp. F390]MDT0575494.1 hypothetical protein [Croceicoccus sp. F390]